MAACNDSTNPEARPTPIPVYSWVDGLAVRGGHARQVVDPGTGQAFAEAFEEDPEALAREATNAATRATGELAKAEPTTRARWLRELADGIGSESAHLAELETMSVGKPLAESRASAGAAVHVLEYYADLVESGALESRSCRSRLGGDLEVQRLPLGPVAHILPWNFPLSMAAARIAMSIAAGCSCVLKPSELAPLTPVEICRLVTGTSLPRGAVNVILGDGALGQALIGQPAIAAVSFTGGSQHGPAVMRTAAALAKPVTLELGGQCANVVLATADLDKAVGGALSAAYLNAGQTCSAAARMLVHRDVVDDFTQALVERVAAMRVGPGLNPATEMGPLITHAARERVASLISDAIAHGMVCRTGGARPQEPALALGYFLRPAILAGTAANARIQNEEVFGPVTVVEPFDEEDELAARINQAPLRLAAGIWGDTAQARAIARRLEVGVVWINTYNEIAPDAPWGGFGMSGFGRILGPEGFHEFTAPRQIFERVARP